MHGCYHYSHMEKIPLTSNTPEKKQPLRRWKAAAFFMLLQQACVHPPAQHPHPEKVTNKEDPWNEEQYRESIRDLAEHFPSSYRLNNQERTSLASVLLGDAISSTEAAWKKELRARTEREPVRIQHEKLRAEEFALIEDVLTHFPNLWKSPSTTSAIRFLPKEVLRHEIQGQTETKTDTDREWKTLCVSTYDKQQNASQILCDVDEMRAYGWEKAVKESFMHEGAHTGDPTRIPLTAVQKSQIWNAFSQWLETSPLTQDPYIHSVKQFAEKNPSARNYAAYLQESWAEAWSKGIPQQQSHAAFTMYTQAIRTE